MGPCPPLPTLQRGYPRVYLWITGWASKYTLYVVVTCSLRFPRSGNFSGEIKKLYRLHRRRVQLPKWSAEVIWRLGTELRHFDQEMWGGNSCDMVVFTADESRDVFLLSYCLYLLCIYSKHCLTETSSLWDAGYAGFNQTWILKAGKSLLISWLFLAARFRWNITDRDGGFHVHNFHVMDACWISLCVAHKLHHGVQPKVSRPPSPEVFHPSRLIIQQGLPKQR